MDALSSCLAELGTVMDAEDDGKVIIAERAIDNYMSGFTDHKAQLQALDRLEEHVRPKIQGPATSAVLSYMGNWRERIETAQEEPLQTITVGCRF
jgi:hypothetical protein